MHYFIDGYNLLFRMLRSGESLHDSREAIISELKKKVNFLELNVSLVFDAAFQHGESTRSHKHEMEVIFTASGETADEYILSELKRVANPRLETVVTSDNKLAWQSRRKGAHSQTVEEFFKWLNARYKNRILQKKSKSQVPNKSLSPLIQKQKIISDKTEEPLKLSKKVDASSKAGFDYYLETFSNEVYKNDIEIEIKKGEAKDRNQDKNSNVIKKGKEKVQQGHKRTKGTKPQEPIISESKRWLHIFEERYNKEGDNSSK